MSGVALVVFEAKGAVRGKLLYVGIALKFVFVNEDGAVVHVSADPQLVYIGLQGERC